MPFKIERLIFDKVASLYIHGKFTLQTKTKFAAAYADLMKNSSVTRIEVFLDNVEYLDVSALGLLLLLKETALVAGKEVSLKNPLGIVAQVLKAAHFDKYFTIEGLMSNESEASVAALGNG